MHWALMACFKGVNRYNVRDALIQAGRQDLIGAGYDALIPAQAPKEALKARRQANGAVRGDHMPTVAHPVKKGEGYRPGRAIARRRDRK